MRVPGRRRSSAPDECGHRAGQFAQAIQDHDMGRAWELLSKESRGVRQGIWGTQNDVDLQLVYQAAHDPGLPMFQRMMEDFRSAVLKYWPLEDLTDLGVAPTSYVDDEHAFAFLPFDVGEEQEVAEKETVRNGLIVPMLLEDGEWRVDLPGWRFAWEGSSGGSPQTL